MIDLKDRLYEDAGSLSHGQKQWLEIGMLLGQEPELLLIDEPAAGMTDEETMKTAELFKGSQKHSLMVVGRYGLHRSPGLPCDGTARRVGTGGRQSGECEE